jgi:hypothetical protein
LFAQQAALVEALLARRYTQSWVVVREVHGLHVDLQDLTWHDWKIFDPRRREEQEKRRAEEEQGRGREEQGNSMVYGL